MTSTQKPGDGKSQNDRPWSVIHLLSEEDSVVVAALRSVVAPMKGKLEGTASRGPFNAIMERVAVPAGVIFEAATVGGIPGWWAKLVSSTRDCCAKRRANDCVVADGPRSLRETALGEVRSQGRPECQRFLW
jgi:hypothetical protein